MILLTLSGRRKPAGTTITPIPGCTLPIIHRSGGLVVARGIKRPWSTSATKTPCDLDRGFAVYHEGSALQASSGSGYRRRYALAIVDALADVIDWDTHARRPKDSYTRDESCKILNVTRSAEDRAIRAVTEAREEEKRSRQHAKWSSS